MYCLWVVNWRKRHIVDAQLTQFDPAPAQTLKDIGVLWLTQKARIELRERPDEPHTQQGVWCD